LCSANPVREVARPRSRRTVPTPTPSSLAILRTPTPFARMALTFAARSGSFLSSVGLPSVMPSPLARAMFQMMGVFSEFERAMIQERVKAGLNREKDDGVTLGRPTLETTDPERAARVKAMRAEGIGVRKIAKKLGVRVGTILRLSEATAP
jgi:hypothetical protein